MIYLQSTQLGSILPGQAEQFPFTVPVIRAGAALRFTAPITFLVGENGSGKSTYLEAVALAAGIIVAGGEDLARDPSLAAVRALGKVLKLTWTKRTRKGFFMRAEDYFGYVRRLAQTRAELEADLAAVEDEYKDRSATAQAFAQLPFQRELHALRTRYGGDLDARSHGESFLSFFQARFVPDGLYLLDEPEAPLSPLRQLAFIKLMQEAVQQGAQFIVATHSPILMACPGAAILSFDQTPPELVAWEALEHVTLTRDFLNNPDAFLRRL